MLLEFMVNTRQRDAYTLELDIKSRYFMVGLCLSKKAYSTLTLSKEALVNAQLALLLHKDSTGEDQ